MAFDTFTGQAERGGQRSTAKLGRQTEFVDGYKQEVVVGLRAISKSVTFSTTGTYDECSAIESFFDSHAKVPFYYRFMPQEPLKLYKLADSYSFEHVSGLTWRISAQFEEYLGY